ncbi:DUF1285 domain-containing protein [Lujinxingia vulgaris]|uniref:DUF1285 domain-containing protein n=1 Tax=Lujinxingia vulgaris TaxID=2600176 RepID=A0A5C6XE73_9DELT|nr:DUF1285 domain-containing protein [Lujinxingia vulgaris]TXD37635.1 DUF1285 domain-containing protein [Lujinxingia vulgaris]
MAENDNTTPTPEDAIDPTLPTVVQDFLRKGGTLQEIRLNAHGTWLHEGLRFENQRVVDLFSRSVNRTEGGTWVLEIGRFTYPIVVEDTGFFVERADWEAVPPRLWLSDGTEEELKAESLRYAEGGRLYCPVKEGRFEARFKRSVYHGIADFLVEDTQGYLLRLPAGELRLEGEDNASEK